MGDTLRIPRQDPAGDSRTPGRLAPFFGLIVAGGVLAAGFAAPPGSGPASARREEALSRLPWSELESPPGDLADTAAAAALRGAVARRDALVAIADDADRSPRARRAALFRLGSDALRRQRWTAATERLTDPVFAGSAIAADALHLLGTSLPGARGGAAIGALKRLLAEHPDSPHASGARIELARRLGAAGAETGLPLLETVIAEAGFTLRGEALAAAADILERVGRREEAARKLEVLYYEMATHSRSLNAGRALSKLYRRADVRSPPAAERYPRAMRRAKAFHDAGNHRKAHENYLEIANRFASAADLELVRLRIGVEESHRGRLSASLRTLSRIRREDLAPEALYMRGESLRRLDRVDAQTRTLEELLALETEHPFGADALYSMGRSRLARNDRRGALPFFVRLADRFPHGNHALFATWHREWDAYREGRLEGAAARMERIAREHPTEFMAGQFLYFAARTHERTGAPEAAVPLYREVFVGYRNSFYGRRAAERLVALGAADELRSPLAEPEALLRPLSVARRPLADRIGELHAAGFRDRAIAAARTGARAGAPDDAAFHGMHGWLLRQRGQNVPAIQAFRRAAPFATSVAGDALPAAWWRMMYPLRYRESLERQAARWELDPHLVAGLIRQESAFVARTSSPVGARGLMQIMPATGRALARLEGVSYQASGLFDPTVNIRFGTRYLRQLLDRFADRDDYALAGYNAGPHRVRNWTEMDMDIPSEIFIEEIPFTETRNYVKLVKRNEMLYRRLYPALLDGAGE